MDIDYSPSVATALLLANLTSLANRAIPNSTSTSVELAASSPPHLPVMVPQQVAEATSPSITPSLNQSVDYHKLAQDILGSISTPPSALPSPPPSVPTPPLVYIINQAVPVPAPPSPGWTPDMDALVGSTIIFILLLIFGAGCWFMKRHRPQAWRSVKIGAVRVLRALALPISWLCGQASALFRRIHQEGASQVSYLISFLASWYTFSYVIGP
jgi:hypothetical protein